MQLTKYTDYGLRTLIYLATAGDNRPISEIAARYKISRNHLVKVVHHLIKLGYLKTLRGRSGGVELAHAASGIAIGRVVRDLEPGFEIAECFAPTRNECVITNGCKLARALDEARHAFLAVLDDYTLEDIVQDRVRLAGLLSIQQAPAPAATGSAKARTSRRTGTCE